MIRINGFARKTRRSTKGGSLPDKASQRNGVDSHHESSEASSHSGRNGKGSGNGTSAQPGNGSEFRGYASASYSRLESSAEFSENGITRKLHEAISRLVSSTAGGGNGNGINGSASAPNSNPLQTIFARPVESGPSKNSGAIPLWKRSLDIACVILSLPVWLPLLLVVMLWIRLVSPGPIFYRQERIGYRRTRFRIFKFRTMHVNAETRTHEEYFAHLMRSDRPMTKLDAVDDSRLIRCGRLLRASGLDELPQILNVVRGDMSLVGPRPCLPNEFDAYQPWQQERANVTPGLTGYWQVNGKNKTTFSEMIAMDIFYSKNVSLWLDVEIMLKTIPALVDQILESRGRNGNGLGVIRIAQSPASASSPEKL